jgi:hypothetical protein
MSEWSAWALALGPSRSWAIGLLVALPADYRLVFLIARISLFACLVWFRPETEAEADTRSSRILEPKPKPKTEKTEILARFGLVWLGFWFQV